MNAVHRAAPMLARIAAHEAPTVTVDGLDYRESLQVVRIEAGIANNVVPVSPQHVESPLSRMSRSTLAQTRALLDAIADEVETVSNRPGCSP